MNHITKFNYYETINEKHGIAEATLFYIDTCAKKSFDFFELTLGDFEVKAGEKYITNIVIPFQEIKRKVKDWDLFSYFPVSQILLDLTIEKKPVDKVMMMRHESTSRYQVPYILNAYASPFAIGRERAATRILDPIKVNQDHSLSLHFGLDLEYSDNFDLERHVNKLKVEIESTILHEMNHLYEYYYRKFGGSSTMKFALTWASVADNNYRRKSEFYRYWYKNFTHLIYLSENHEVNAWVHQCKPYVDKLDFRTFQRTVMWKTPSYMKNWSYEKFLKDFERYVKQLKPEYEFNSFIEVLIKDFIKTYRKMCLDMKEDPIIKIETLESMSNDDFFIYFEKKIKKSGDRLVKNISRLYSDKENQYDDF